MRIIPAKDADFNTVQSVIIAGAADNVEKWTLNADWLTKELQPAAEKWDNAWAAYQPAKTRTPLITFTKNEARKKYEPLLRQLVKILKANPLVTDDDLIKLGIAVQQSARTPAQVPDTYPVFTVDSGTIRRLKIHFRDVNGLSAAKPRGVHGAEIKWGVGVVPVAGADSLSNSSFDTRSPFMLEFAEPDRGKTVYFCLRWENSTGAKGPWGEIGTAIIP